MGRGRNWTQKHIEELIKAQLKRATPAGSGIVFIPRSDSSGGVYNVILRNISVTDTSVSYDLECTGNMPANTIIGIVVADYPNEYETAEENIIDLFYSVMSSLEVNAEEYGFDFPIGCNYTWTMDKNVMKYVASSELYAPNGGIRGYETKLRTVRDLTESDTGHYSFTVRQE